MRALRPCRSASHGDWHTAMQHYGEALQRNRCNGAFWHFRSSRKRDVVLGLCVCFPVVCKAHLCVFLRASTVIRARVSKHPPSGTPPHHICTHTFTKACSNVGPCLTGRSYRVSLALQASPCGTTVRAAADAHAHA